MADASARSAAERVALLPPADRAAFYESLTDAECDALRYEWAFWGRPAQQPPAGDWGVWLLLGGRGSGKTRPLCELVVRWARAVPRIAIVGRTAADVRDTLVEGVSGVLACSPPSFWPNYEPSKRRLTWPNGTMATTFSADEPDAFRGPAFHRAACDELAAWKYPQEAWDNLSLGVREGDSPQFVVATTPRPIRLLREIIADPYTRVTHMTTYDNLVNLAPAFRRRILARYEGTRLGRQELGGEMIDDVVGALWTLAIIDAARVRHAPELVRVVVAVDPPSGGLGRRVEGEEDDEEGAECGIVVVGLAADGHAYVLEDCTVRGTPAQWGRAAVEAYWKHRADRIVGEVNNGGEMVGYVVTSVAADDPRGEIAYAAVWASRGKYARAEPVSALYEQSRVHHVGAHAELEDQMRTWVPTLSLSPDRIDALVWGISAFFFSEEERTTARALDEAQVVQISPL